VSAKFANNAKVGIDCPECREMGRGVAQLIVKTNRMSGDGAHQFLGCPNWPECRYTRGIPESLVMRANGQPELF